ncbi:hypothetical protein CEE45_10700 [Candidatus Heimdallarchaeota archaeon B3_Heim]|nr:MAG: hypothetical protein CEE45_10700 [Candidatus Heimdallarchaeota archaeon B3_Heim]
MVVRNSRGKKTLETITSKAVKINHVVSFLVMLNFFTIGTDLNNLIRRNMNYLRKTTKSLNLFGIFNFTHADKYIMQ